jgi:hypothetical protein
MGKKATEPETPQVDFMVRVKLPHPGTYYTPNAENDGPARDYSDALSAAKPPGYEFVYPAPGHQWPVDSAGYTYARLHCPGDEVALAYWMDRSQRLDQTLRRMRTAIAKAIGGS